MQYHQHQVTNADGITLAPPVVTYTPKTLQDALGIGQKHSYRLFHTSGFPAIKIGGKWLVEHTELMRWLAQNKGKEVMLAD
jgi:excisionase family DNA binding protein